FVCTVSLSHTLSDSRMSLFTLSFFSPYRAHRYLHSFPTRRSSDLLIQNKEIRTAYLSPGSAAKQTTDPPAARFNGVNKQTPLKRDRKSTRLNSSHEWISYAVFCLKKKKNIR